MSEEGIDEEMTVWESNSTLFSWSDSVDLLRDLLGDLLWGFKRFSKFDIVLVNSDAGFIVLFLESRSASLAASTNY